MSLNVQFGSLLVVAGAAFAVPLLLALVPRAAVPAVVGEVVAGIALGESGAGWITLGPFLEFLFLFGLAFLLFLAGLEVDFGLLRRSFGRSARTLLRSPLGIGVMGLGIRLALAFAVSVPLRLLDLVARPTLVAILLTSTSLGVVLSVLKERDLLGEPYGQLLLVSAAVADFGTVLLLTVFFSAEGRSPGAQAALAGSVVLLGLVLLAGLRAASRARALGDLIERLSGATAQIRIRGSLALLLAFVALAAHLGLEVILGAFIAGAVLSALSVQREHPLFQVKIDAVGYGFFVPVFFVLAGAKLDVPALLASGSDLVLVPVLLVAVFAIKVVPAWPYRVYHEPRACLAGGILQSAQLTLTVAGVEIGKRLGLVDEALASALVLVALLSVLIAPPLFAWLLPAPRPEPEMTAGQDPSRSRRQSRLLM